MKKVIGKCKNCGHQICLISKEKNMVNKLFNGQIVHANGRHEWAVICRVGKCGCMKPEIEIVQQVEMQDKKLSQNSLKKEFIHTAQAEEQIK